MIQQSLLHPPYAVEQNRQKYRLNWRSSLSLIPGFDIHDIYTQNILEYLALLYSSDPKQTDD